MASHDEWAGSGSVDPAFAELFRAEDAPAVPAPGAPAAPAAHPDPAPVSAPAPSLDADSEPDLEPEQEPEPAPVPSPEVDGPSVDTGRLFRSQGVVGQSAAVLALSSDHGGRLRTLARSDAPPAPDAQPAHAPLPTPAALLVDSGPADLDAPPSLAADPAARSRGRRARSADGLRAGAVYLLVIGVTLAVGFVNALLANGDVGLAHRSCARRSSASTAP